jgi:large subunit ribosomal protein L1
MLLGNLSALTYAIVQDRPAALKGQYFRSAYLTSSMGPSIPVDLAAVQALRPED